MEWVERVRQQQVYTTPQAHLLQTTSTLLCAPVNNPHKHDECTYEKSPAANFASAREKPASFIISPMSDLL